MVTKGDRSVLNSTFYWTSTVLANLKTSLLGGVSPSKPQIRPSHLRLVPVSLQSTDESGLAHHQHLSSGGKIGPMPTQDLALGGVCYVIGTEFHLIRDDKDGSITLLASKNFPWQALPACFDLRSESNEMI